MSENVQLIHNQSGSQSIMSCMSQSIPTQIPQNYDTQVRQTVTALQAPISISSLTQQIAPFQAQDNLQNIIQDIIESKQLMQCECQDIWQGTLEWSEKTKNPIYPTDIPQKITKHIPCKISANLKNGNPELKADTWPSKLIVQLISKELIGNIDSFHLKNYKSVFFHPTICEASESLTRIISTRFVGCVHFISFPPNPSCEIKKLLLFYIAEKKLYLGLIPNDQTAFMNNLREVIQQKIMSHMRVKQEQDNPDSKNTIPVFIPTPNMEGNIPTPPPFQTNTVMAIHDGQITHNVISSNVPLQTLSSTTRKIQMNMQLNQKCLSKVARRKLRWLIFKGFNYEDARKKTLKLMTLKNKGSKQFRCDSLTSCMEKKRKQQDRTFNSKQMQQKTVETFKQASERRKVGVVHNRYPDVNLTTNQLKAIQEAIIEKILDVEEGSLKPKFAGTIFKTGYLVINCADEVTEKWLCNIIPNLKLWEGFEEGLTDLKALYGKELPKTHTFFAYFPGSAEDSNEKILKLVKIQNEGLHTASWRILKRGIKGANTAHLILSIDDQSAKKLKACNYRVSFKLGEITIKPKGTLSQRTSQANDIRTTRREANKILKN